MAVSVRFELAKMARRPNAASSGPTHGSSVIQNGRSSQRRILPCRASDSCKPIGDRSGRYRFAFLWSDKRVEILWSSSENQLLPFGQEPLAKLNEFYKKGCQEKSSASTG